MTKISSQTEFTMSRHLSAHNRDLTQSGRGDRTTPPITSFDYHVLPEGVALFDPYARKTATETCLGARNKP